MLDLGWNELLIIALVTIIVVGPKELPHVLRTVTQFVRKLRGMASEFQSGIDDLAREAELEDLKKSIEKTSSKDIAAEFENTIDPTGEVAKSVRDIETSVKEETGRPVDPPESPKADAPSAPASEAAGDDKGTSTDDAGKKSA